MNTARTPIACVFLVAMLVTGCAGLAIPLTSGTTQTPVPEPTPSSQPANTTDPNAFTTAEYYGTDGLNAFALDVLGAASAYGAGGTGEGVTIAVIDSGVDASHPEFSGQIHPNSLDIAGQRDPGTDEDGHGTFVAGLIAASRDDAGMHGLAFDSQLLMVRADIPGSCAEGACLYAADDVARAINAAIIEGADIINISLAGLTTPDPRIAQALDNAVNAGIVVVAAAGNTGAQSPDYPAAFAGSQGADGLAIAVGAATREGIMAGFSNRAGDTAPAYLLAPGVGVTSTMPASTCSTTTDRCYATGSGTSYAAPYVAGSIALLLDAFPNLTPRQAVSLLLDTATDVGDAGVDRESGAGFVNLDAAFSPVGTTSVSLRTASITPDSNLSTQTPVTIETSLQSLFAQPTGAFGDWAWNSGAFDGIIARDAYNRAFVISPPTIVPPSAAQARFVSAAGALSQTGRMATTRFASAYVSQPTPPIGGFGHIAAAQDVGHITGAPFVSSAGSTPLSDPSVSGSQISGPAFAAHFAVGPVSVSTGRGTPAVSGPAHAFAVGGTGTAITLPPSTTAPLSRQAWAHVQLAENADWRAARVRLAGWAIQSRHADGGEHTLWAAGIGRRFGRHWVLSEHGQRTQRHTVLGSRILTRLGGDDVGRDSFTSLQWGADLPRAWQLNGRIQWAQQHLADAPTAQITTQPAASGWALGLTRAKPAHNQSQASLQGLRPNHQQSQNQSQNQGHAHAQPNRSLPLPTPQQWGLTVWQPLRAEGGAIAILAPTGVGDNPNGSIFTPRRAALTPSGREINIEAAAAWLFHQRLQITTSILATHQPGHIAKARPQAALWASITLKR